LTWLFEPDTCPGLFYGTSAQDGFLIRLRTPGGLINLSQGEAITQLFEELDLNTIQVTNRANFQIRGLKKAPSTEVFQTLSKLGLAGKNPRLDHLRNVMSSPTVGIDSQELINTHPFVFAILNYIENNPHLIQLSPKFSIGIDGGGQVSIGTRSNVMAEHRYNEIQFSAVNYHDQIFFHLALGGDKKLWDTEILIDPKDCISVLDALITVYLDYVISNPREKKLRLKHLLQDWGLTKYLKQVQDYLTFPLTQAKITLSPTLPYGHLGIHSQKQEGLSYIGLSLILGHLTVNQWRGLVNLSHRFGNEEIRLTPWQSLLLPNIPTTKVKEIIPLLEDLGLSPFVNQPQGAIVSCAGKPFCGSAITQTQLHAKILIQYLQERIKLDYPVNIHLTGCPKSCAQPSPAEITLLGTMIEQEDNFVEGYKIYVGNGQESLKSKVGEYAFVDVPQIIEKLIKEKHRT